MPMMSRCKFLITTVTIIITLFLNGKWTSSYSALLYSEHFIQPVHPFIQALFPPMLFLGKCFLSNMHTHLYFDGCIRSNLDLVSCSGMFGMQTGPTLQLEMTCSSTWHTVTPVRDICLNKIILIEMNTQRKLLFHLAHCHCYPHIFACGLSERINTHYLFICLSAFNY